jgi:amidase
MTDIAFKSATELAGMIQDKQIGCRELLDHCLDRVEKYDGDLNAIPVRDFERARTRADAADAALAKGEVWGPLHGVPMTIKESYDIEGLPTCWGLEEHANSVATKDSVTVERMKGAGVTLFGKTNVPVLLADWQSYNPVYGSTNNPWDKTRTPGGSSGGSAVALATGMSAIESGSDIGASIRNPAHYCGVFGHKPTFGIVSPRGHALPGVMAQADISVVGPLARSAKDLDVALDAMVGPAGPDANCWKVELPACGKTKASEFKVAVMLTDKICAQDDVMTAQLQGAVDALAKLGMQVDDTARPDFDNAEYHATYIRLLRAATGGRTPPAIFNAMLEEAASVSDDDYSYSALQAKGTTTRHREWLTDNERRAHYREAWDSFFQDYDLLLCPTASSTAFKHDQKGDRKDRVIPINGKPESILDQMFWAGISGVAYLPSTVAPAGVCANGLPCGLQIVAPHGHDKRSIAFAAMMERELGGFTPPPGY